MRALSSHIIPILTTAIIIVAAWAVLTLPIVAVFIFDDEFHLTTYLRFLLYTFAVGLALSAGVFCPAAMILKKVVLRRKWLGYILPVFLLFVSTIAVLVRWIYTGEFIETARSWQAVSFALSALFACYWFTLMVLQLIIVRK